MQDFRGLIIKKNQRVLPGHKMSLRHLKFNRMKWEETPCVFSRDLRDQMRKYPGLEPEDPVGQGLFKS